MKATQVGLQTQVESSEFHNEFSALAQGALGTLLGGFVCATGITWFAGAAANPGEPDFWEVFRDSLATVRLPSGVDPAAIAFSSSAIVLTLVLAVSISEPRTLEPPGGRVARSVWLARVAQALSVVACTGQVWLCAAALTTCVLGGSGTWLGVGATALATLVTCALAPLTVTPSILLLDRSALKDRLYDLAGLIEGEPRARSRWRALPWSAICSVVFALLIVRLLVSLGLSPMPNRESVLVAGLIASAYLPIFVMRGAWTGANAPVQRIMSGVWSRRVDRAIHASILGVVSISIAGSLALGIGETPFRTLVVFISVITMDVMAQWVFKLPRASSKLRDSTQAIAVDARLVAQERLDALERRVRALNDDHRKPTQLMRGPSRGFAAPRKVSGVRRRRERV